LTTSVAGRPNYPLIGELMADVTVTTTLSDLQAKALAIVAASLGPEQFESAYQHWLNHWKATDAYSPDVEAKLSDRMSGAAKRLYTALAEAGYDVLSPMGPRAEVSIIH